MNRRKFITNTTAASATVLAFPSTRATAVDDIGPSSVTDLVMVVRHEPATPTEIEILSDSLAPELTRLFDTVLNKIQVVS